ncbi:xylulokinase [Thalassococcus lentus]|uniref:Xylulose kinase n=1 Tax=Thalassococcus lentus TaxID=1210524 RepID=A0ABT4XPK0_9RHOB|nr:xylulokinase [Thalassococcus lentus]MDA7423827.1 xylulokinase [Thalassococcus lentus]
MYLGLDLGTSGLKALLIDEDQNPIAEATAPLTVSRRHVGWSEQDPADWISAAEHVLDKLAGTVDLSGVKGIGLSGHMHGATMLDANDDVLWPCILWNDTRSSEQASAMDGDPIWRAISGNIVFPGFTAPKVQWMRETHPEVFNRISSVLLPKDYLRFWLTGEKMSEMSDAAGTSWLDTCSRDWSDTLLERSGLSREEMPGLVEGSQVSGTLRPSLAARWGFSGDVPVAGGAGDNAASALGMGVVKSGQAFVSLGTSGVLFAACDGFQPDPETAVHTFCHALPDMWHQMGVILAATDALNWWANLVGSDPVSLTRELGALQAPGATAFLPYLGGERTPLNSASVRGGFVGLDHATDRAAGTRAVLEGVAFALADNRDALAAAGTTVESCVAVGGGSQSEYWLQVVATALNIPLDVPVGGDFGAAFGAARLGMIAATGDASIAVPPPIKTTVEPVSALSQAFQDAHARFREAALHMMELS